MQSKEEPKSAKPVPETRIRLLPESLANQIAAGEVVQRPASVVKELLENALDAEAKRLILLVKDGGKSLIQVIDDGFGMSHLDARMAFERHATSKIKTLDDLFRVQTMGFRGEALASIAAVAQVELRTRTLEEELGTALLVEGGNLISQEACVVPVGTSIAVRRLFFNVPARRNFLKSDSLEFKHMHTEFLRIALGDCKRAFELHHNDQVYYQLPVQAPAARISALQNIHAEKLIAVEQNNDYISIHGFIGHPESAKGSRGEQFFWVNGRFIKSTYLNNAISRAYDSVLKSNEHPSYYLHLTTDPQNIDINIHPTKTEIKFNDESFSFKLLFMAVREALRTVWKSSVAAPEHLPPWEENEKVTSGEVCLPVDYNEVQNQQSDQNLLENNPESQVISPEISVRPSKTRASYNTEWNPRSTSFDTYKDPDSNEGATASRSHFERESGMRSNHLEMKSPFEVPALFSEETAQIHLLGDQMVGIMDVNKWWFLHMPRLQNHFRVKHERLDPILKDELKQTKILMIPEELFALSSEEVNQWTEIQSLLTSKGYKVEKSETDTLLLHAYPDTDTKTSREKIKKSIERIAMGHNFETESDKKPNKFDSNSVFDLILLWQKEGRPTEDAEGNRLAVAIEPRNSEDFFNKISSL